MAPNSKQIGHNNTEHIGDNTKHSDDNNKMSENEQRLNIARRHAGFFGRKLDGLVYIGHILV